MEGGRRPREGGEDGHEGHWSIGVSSEGKWVGERLVEYGLWVPKEKPRPPGASTSYPQLLIERASTETGQGRPLPGNDAAGGVSLPLPAVQPPRPHAGSWGRSGLLSSSSKWSEDGWEPLVASVESRMNTGQRRQAFSTCQWVLSSTDCVCEVFLPLSAWGRSRGGGNSPHPETPACISDALLALLRGLTFAP